MIVYDGLGFKIKVFKKEDGIELFKYFTENRMNNRENIDAYSERRKSLKIEVNNALNNKNHNPLGLYKDDILIGVCMSYFSEKPPLMPVIKYIHIQKEYKDGILPYILFNFLINVVYCDEEIRSENSLLKEYGSIVREMPDVIGFSIFNNRFKDNLKRYFKDK